MLAGSYGRVTDWKQYALRLEGEPPSAATDIELARVHDARGTNPKLAPPANLLRWFSTSYPTLALDPGWLEGCLEYLQVGIDCSRIVVGQY